MSIKLKSEDSDQPSLIMRFQHFIGHGRTHQIDINASPSKCLDWVASLAGPHPEDIKLSVETQAVKQPYQLTVHIRRRYRPIEFGIVIGDVIQSPISANKSIVNLHFYHGIGRLLELGMVLGISILMGFTMTIVALDALVPSTASTYPVEKFLCFGGIGLWFIGIGIFGVIKFLGTWRKLLDLVSAHLLKLNTEQNTVDL